MKRHTQSAAKSLVFVLGAIGFFTVLSLATTENVFSVIVGLQYCNFIALLAIAYLLSRRAGF